MKMQTKLVFSSTHLYYFGVSSSYNYLLNVHFLHSPQSDARALRVVLSLTGVKEGLRGHIVVEMSDLDNEPLVKLVGGELIETVVAHDVIGRLMIQCALQPGLAQVHFNVTLGSAVRKKRNKIFELAYDCNAVCFCIFARGVSP